MIVSPAVQGATLQACACNAVVFRITMEIQGVFTEFYEELNSTRLETYYYSH